MTSSAFPMSAATFFDDVKEWSGLFSDTYQLGFMLNFDVDVKILQSTSKFSTAPNENGFTGHGSACMNNTH